MAYRVVCISATDGAAGEEIGTLVASRLGFRLVNEQIVARAAEQAGVEGHVMGGVEQRRSLIRRVLDELPAAAASSSTLMLAPPTITDPIPAEHLRGLIRSAIEETAGRGEAVILSHAASYALATRADTLRVLITAAPDTRRARIKAARQVTEKEAGKLLARGDAHRADYFKRFYHVPAELPTHYDIVVNSDRLSVEQAADIILQTASSAPASA